MIVSPAGEGVREPPARLGVPITSAILDGTRTAVPFLKSRRLLPVAKSLE